MQGYWDVRKPYGEGIFCTKKEHGQPCSSGAVPLRMPRRIVAFAGAVLRRMRFVIFEHLRCVVRVVIVFVSFVLLPLFGHRKHQLLFDLGSSSCAIV